MSGQSTDLNADLGEGQPNDERLLRIVTSCSIACGGHAGDSNSMSEAVRLAAEHGVTVGAHPSYPDREGFGRRSEFTSGTNLFESLQAQLTTLSAVCETLCVPLKTLKPHGALYNDARENVQLAEQLVELADLHGLTLIGPPVSETERAARRRGVPYLREGFVDRVYLSDGSLSPRENADAVFDSASAAAEQAVRLARGLSIPTADNRTLQLAVDTLCIHGDTPNAVETAEAVKALLLEAGIAISSHGG